MSRAVRLLLLAALIAHLPLADISHAQSDPLKCQRAVLKGVTKLFKAKSKILQKCEEGKTKGKHSEDCPCAPGPGCAVGGPGDKAAQSLMKAESNLESAIAKKCGGANKVCGDGDDNLDMSTLFYPTCPDFQNACGTGPIADCQDLTSCLNCIAANAIDRFTEALYGGFDAAKFGASAPGDKEINRCQIALGKEAVKFVLAKQKTVAKCWDKRYKAKHAADCPFLGGNPATEKDAVKAAQKVAKSEAKKIAKLCKACGGTDKACDDTVMAVNAGVIPPVGTIAGDDLLLTDAYVGVGPFNCPDLSAPATADRGPVDCAQKNPMTTVADLVFCVDCLADFEVDCTNAAATTNAFGGTAVTALECNPP